MWAGCQRKNLFCTRSRVTTTSLITSLRHTETDFGNTPVPVLLSPVGVSKRWREMGLTHRVLYVEIPVEVVSRNGLSKTRKDRLPPWTAPTFPPSGGTVTETGCRGPFVRERVETASDPTPWYKTGKRGRHDPPIGEGRKQKRPRCGGDHGVAGTISVRKVGRT